MTSSVFGFMEGFIHRGHGEACACWEDLDLKDAHSNHPRQDIHFIHSLIFFFIPSIHPFID